MNTTQVDPSIYVFKETEVKKSMWKNNTDDIMSFKLLLDQKRPGINRPGFHTDGSKCQGSLFLFVSIKPGETVELDSQFDNAIRFVSPKSGTVESGLAPCLTKVGEENVVIPEAFDYKTAIEEAECEKIIKSHKKAAEMKMAFELRDKQQKEKAELKALMNKVEAVEAVEAAEVATVVVKKKGGRPKKVVTTPVE